MQEPTAVEAQPEVQNGTQAKASRAVAKRPYFQAHPYAKWLLLGLMISVILGVIGLWRYYGARESTDDAEVDGHIIAISAKVGGTIAAVNVKDNQFVEAGTVLVQIDPADYRIALERAQADLADAQAMARAAGTSVPIASTTARSQISGAQANVQSAAAGVAMAEKEVAAASARLGSAQAKVREAEANETKAARDLERLKQLVTKDEISRQQYDAAIATAAAAQAATQSAQAGVKEANQGVETAQSRWAQTRAQSAEARAAARSTETAPQQIAVTRDRADSAQAKAQQAEAMLDQAQLNFQYTTIKAPVSGIVSKKSVEVGQIAPTDQPLLAIVPLEDIWVTANFKETQLRLMHSGQSAEISVDAFGGRKYQGHVESIAAATGAKFSLLPPENAAGNYVKVVQRVPVKIVFEKGQDSEHLLRPGMSVNPTVYVK